MLVLKKGGNEGSAPNNTGADVKMEDVNPLNQINEEDNANV